MIASVGYEPNGRQRKQYGPPDGSMAATIKARMEGGNIFGGQDNNKNDVIRKAYQDQLRDQLDSKKREKEEAKQRQMAEDKYEDEKIRRELEELNQQYAREIKEDKKGGPPEPFDFGNVDNRNIAKVNSILISV
jgi:hypothetical protein